MIACKLELIENIYEGEKGENAGHQPFSFLQFLQCFQNPFFRGSVKCSTVMS